MYKRALEIVLFPVVAAILMLSTHTALASSDSGPRIIVLETMEVPVVVDHSRVFERTIRSLGYSNIQILKGEGKREIAVRRLKDAISSRKPDIVVSIATLASQAAAEVLDGTDIPLVFAVVSDPVGAGLIEKVGEPTGRNVTGRIHSLLRDVKIDLAVRLVGQLITDRPIQFGVVRSDYPASVGDSAALRKTAEKNERVEFIDHQVAYRKIPEGLESMLSDIAEGINAVEEQIDFWWQPVGPIAEVADYTALFNAASKKTVAMANTVNAVRMGALMAATPNFEGAGKEVAHLVQDILNGLDPGDVPVVAPSSFDLAVNLSTALELGIIVPSDILTLATPNVFR